MDRMKQFILKHFEKILIGVILIAAFLGTLFIEEKNPYPQLLLSPRDCGRLFSRTSNGSPDCSLLYSYGRDLHFALPPAFLR